VRTIRLIGVGMQFASRELFRDVCLTLAEGELVAFTGPSGSGKSTLLSIASGLIAPTTGAVYLASGDTESARMSPREVSWVPQGNNALGARTVLENAMIGSLANGCRRRQAAEVAMAALTTMGLSQLYRQPAALLSGGELQRLAVARALCSARPFLFADEPTGSLDRDNSASVTRAIRSAAELGLGVLVASHDPAVAASCDRVYVVDRQVRERT
jgi:ABC-type lipoprotein export system ATPase subunit